MGPRRRHSEHLRGAAAVSAPRHDPHYAVHTGQVELPVRTTAGEVEGFGGRPRTSDAGQIPAVGVDRTPAVAELHHRHTARRIASASSEKVPRIPDHDDGVPLWTMTALRACPIPVAIATLRSGPAPVRSAPGALRPPDRRGTVHPPRRPPSPRRATADHHRSTLGEQPAELVREVHSCSPHRAGPHTATCTAMPATSRGTLRPADRRGPQPHRGPVPQGAGAAEVPARVHGRGCEDRSA